MSSKKTGNIAPFPIGTENDATEKRILTVRQICNSDRNCGGFRISAAFASFDKKREDRISFVTINNEPLLWEAQKKHKFPQTLTAFIGVFDGHDGDEASEYCSRGLLRHVIAETEECSRCVEAETSRDCGLDEDPMARNRSIVDNGFVNAYRWAERRFATYSDAPGWKEVGGGVKSSRTNMSFCRRVCFSGQRLRRGGTTAVTMALYGNRPTDNHHNNNRISITPILSAVISNCGDSRCITDDATSTSTFRQITTDHRPADPSENRRLKPYVRRGDTIVKNDKAEIGGTLRVHPGGLAVSRTVGDVSCSQAVICTPDMFHVPLHLNLKDAVQRFIFGSDGLWDCLTNEQVGEVGAYRQPVSSSHIPTIEREDKREEELGIVGVKEAAGRILDLCMKNGGEGDDVTILVVDVCLFEKNEGSNV